MHILLRCLYLRLCCFHCILYLLVSFICHSLSLLLQLWMGAHYEILMTLTSHWLCFRTKVTCHSLWLPWETCMFFQFTFLLLFMNLHHVPQCCYWISTVSLCMNLLMHARMNCIIINVLTVWKVLSIFSAISRSGHRHLELLIQS